jgi:hypothetical protein
VTAFDRPRRAVHSHRSGELDADRELLYEPLDDDRARYTQVMRFRSSPAFRPPGVLLERLVLERRIQRDFVESILPNFERLAEARAVTH